MRFDNHKKGFRTFWHSNLVWVIFELKFSTQVCLQIQFEFGQMKMVTSFSYLKVLLLQKFTISQNSGHCIVAFMSPDDYKRATQIHIQGSSSRGVLTSEVGVQTSKRSGKKPLLKKIDAFSAESINFSRVFSALKVKCFLPNFVIFFMLLFHQQWKCYQIQI